MNGYVVGVDFGTLSARALVVDARDGAELGTAVFEYPHGVMDRSWPRPARSCRRSGRCRTPRTTWRRCASAVPAAVAAAGVDPRSGRRDRHRLHRQLAAARRVADGTPLCALPGAPRLAKLWKHHAAQRQADRINARRSAASRGSRATAGASPPSGRSRRRCRCSTRSRSCTRAWTAGSRPRTGSSGSCAGARRATPHCRLQGHPPGRRLSQPRVPGRARPAVRGLLADKLDGPLLPLGARAGALTARAAAWTGLPPGIAVAVGNVDAHVTAPAARPSTPASC